MPVRFGAEIQAVLLRQGDYMNTTEIAGLFPPPTELDGLREKHRAALMRAEIKLLESSMTYYDDTQIIDPEDRLKGPDGKPWLEVGGGQTHAADFTDDDLKAARTDGRALAKNNEFAICGAENRISYVVGTGHQYDPEPIQGTPLAKLAEEDAEKAREQMQPIRDVLERFCKANKWHRRQQETMRRYDRDGETILRLFRHEGTIKVRYVEPGQLFTPEGKADDPNVKFGVETDPQDVETVRAYWIDGQAVDPSEIQHRKANVDCNVRRGWPTFEPVKKNLRRAEKLLRNMGAVSAIQAAIAMLRKRPGTNKTTAQQLIEDNADASVYNSRTGKTTRYTQYGPGAILDVPAGVDYEFPSQAIDAARFVQVLQAELRGVAARLCMPEFMLTADASNANYSSTMVAEGPAVKMFERLQAEMIEDDLEIIDRALDVAVEEGALDEGLRSQVKIVAQAPTLVTRDTDKETDATVKATGGKQVMSLHTARRKLNLDPDFEGRKIAEEKAANDPFAGMENPSP